MPLCIPASLGLVNNNQQSVHLFLRSVSSNNSSLTTLLNRMTSIPLSREHGGPELWTPSISGPLTVRTSTFSGIHPYPSVSGRRQGCLPPGLRLLPPSYLCGLLVPTSFIAYCCLSSVAEFWLKRNSSEIQQSSSKIKQTLHFFHGILCLSLRKFFGFPWHPSGLLPAFLVCFALLQFPI